MIPDFQSIMLPLLEFFGDGNVRASKEAREAMINHFRISEDEQKEKTPNGKQYLYYNRIAWSISYLKMAELISSPDRGKYVITDLGQKILQNPPDRISVKFLKSLPKFSINRNPTKNSDDSNIEDGDTIEKTPDELIELGYGQIKNDLSKVLMDHISQSSAFFFEKLVVDLLLNMGYGGSDIENGEVTSKTGDEGIDGIIKEDKLGLDKIYVQAKKWGNTVGRPDIQKFVGALQGKRAKKGIFITTSNFSKEAIEYVKNLDVVVVLIDGEKLTDLMIENDLGVTVKNVFKIRKLDSDYFEEQ